MPLDSILRNLRLDTLLFAGVNVDQCVLHTLADANFPGYDTIMLEDCAATTNPGFCREATLLNIRQIFGFTVMSAALQEALPTWWRRFRARRQNPAQRPRHRRGSLLRHGRNRPGNSGRRHPRNRPR